MTEYKKILTEDGSTTIYSPIYDENCHSSSGAKEETLLHYIHACNILETEHSPINILEVGFGTGLGFMTTKEALAGKRFNFVSLEIDPQMIQLAQESYLELRALSGDQELSLQKENFELKILLGDARETLKNFKTELQFHAIYQDAFSPKKNSSLWTVEWFELLKSFAHEDCIMSTYSSSSSIRKSMLQAGWKLYEGEKFGPKRSSTRARLKGKTDTSISEKLERSPAITLTDHNSKDYK